MASACLFGFPALLVMSGNISSYSEDYLQNWHEEDDTGQGLNKICSINAKVTVLRGHRLVVEFGHSFCFDFLQWLWITSGSYGWVADSWIEMTMTSSSIIYHLCFLAHLYFAVNLQWMETRNKLYVMYALRSLIHRIGRFLLKGVQVGQICN